MSAVGSLQVLGVLASNETEPDYPDIQIYFNSYIATCAPGEVDALQSSGPRIVIIGSSYLHPKSRGRITLASNDPLELPVIQANYLSASEDLEQILTGIKMFLKLVDTEALRAYNFTVVDSYGAACSDYTFLSDEYFICVIKQFNYALYHQGGTCKMGPASDPMAVVDSRLRVHGIKGLRVADTSIMPQLPSCNTATPAMMIGERAADFIKKDWKSKNDRKALGRSHRRWFKTRRSG